jgi:hypothetical protein
MFAPDQSAEHCSPVCPFRGARPTRRKPPTGLFLGGWFLCEKPKREKSDDSDDWPGNKIKIRCVKTNYAGKTVDGLRIEPIVPRPALKDDLNDEVPL